jgi:hypothetical protein
MPPHSGLVKRKNLRRNGHLSIGSAKTGELCLPDRNADLSPAFRSKIIYGDLVETPKPYSRDYTKSLFSFGVSTPDSTGPPRPLSMGFTNIFDEFRKFVRIGIASLAM